LNIMRRFLTAVSLAALVFGVFACGGSGSSPQNLAGPSTPPADAITIDIVGINGAQSFSPNPATLAAGHTVVWHNVDKTTHRVVLDYGELDTGNLGPGAFSAPMTLGVA
jgi:plastocyanin